MHRVRCPRERQQDATQLEERNTQEEDANIKVYSQVRRAAPTAAYTATDSILVHLLSAPAELLAWTRAGCAEMQKVRSESFSDTPNALRVGREAKRCWMEWQRQRRGWGVGAVKAGGG